MTSAHLTDLEPLDGSLPQPEIPLYSRWRHAEGEEVVVLAVEVRTHKEPDGSWADLVMYGVPKLQRPLTRTRANFLARFEPLPDIAALARDFLRNAGHAETCDSVEREAWACSCGRVELVEALRAARGEP